MNIYNIYNIKPVGEWITGNPYVGRGILIGRSANGSKAVFAYFIMGRSDNSRNRVFAKTDDGIRVRPFDPGKIENPELILYTPVRRCGDSIVVSNGNQTDTIVEYLEKGSDMETALETRSFEPDGPNFTPRISGQLIFGGDGAFRYKMSVLKSMDDHGSACTRHYFRYQALPGLGHFIHTYITDGEPLPSFTGEPERVFIPDSIDALADDLWENMDSGNKISLYVCSINLKTGEEEYRLVNKNQ